MSSDEKKCPKGPSDSADLASRSVDEKVVDPSSAAGIKQEEKECILSQSGAEILASESDESIKSGGNEEDKLSASNTTSGSKENDSSLRLEIDTTPDGITRIPESQESNQEESIVEASRSSTIEIETTETTTEKGSLSLSYGCEGNSRKQSFHHSDAKENIFGKSVQEEEHSLQISQDELFGSHTGVVASTPQSNINTRLLLQKEVTHVDTGNEEEMIPSSPEEKKKKSSGLSMGHGYLKREKVSLSLSRNSAREEPSSASPDVVEITEDVIVISPVKDIKRKDSEASDCGKRRIDFYSVECKDLESQETIYSESEDKFSSELTSKEISAKYKELKVSESGGQDSSEYGQRLGDDFDTEPIAAIEQSLTDDESQELGKEAQENQTGDLDEDGRPRCGLKRKLQDLKLVTPKDLILGKRDSSDEDFEVEVLEVKKPRQSVEVVYAKPTIKSSQKYISSSAKSSSSSHSSNSSSSSSNLSISPMKSFLSRKLSIRSNVSGIKIVKSPLESEDFVEEEFSLHISQSEEYLKEKQNDSPPMPTEPSNKDTKASNNCGTMSTIIEVDEGCPSLNESSLLSSKEPVKNTPEEEKKEPPENEEIAMDCEEVRERSSQEVIRPSSPEYLSGEDVGDKSWTGLSKDDVKERADKEGKEESPEEGEKTASTEPCSNGHLSDHGKISNWEEDVTLKEMSNGVPEEGKKKIEVLKKPAAESKKNDTSADPVPTAEIDKWFLVHVVQNVVVKTGKVSSTKILEIQPYPGENGKNTPKEKIYGRVSDVSKTSSVDSKSSACLGDVSSPPNPISPQSVSGDAKLLTLPPTRTSIMSTFSHSSSSTSGSDLAINQKSKEKPTFTKPNQPLITAKDKHSDISPDLKTLKNIKSDAPDSATNIPKQCLNMPEQAVFEIEQAIHEYSFGSDNKNLITKAALEETIGNNLPERRYLSRRSKAKRLPNRLRRKTSSSSKTSSSPALQDSSKNTEDQDTLPIEETLGETTSPPKAADVFSSLTPLSARTKEGRSRSRHPSQKKSSDTSSENSSVVKRLKCSQEDCPTEAGIPQELPCTPRSSATASVGVTCGMLSEGALVFARFSDKWYYPGKARQQQKDDRWIIGFDDGNVRWVKEEYIVAVDVLEQGQSVYAAVGENDAEYEPGIVTRVEIKKNQACYTVELDIGMTEVFPRSKICLTEDQVNIIKELKEEPFPSTPKRKADVSLDNVLEGKRTRGRKTAESAGPSTTITVKTHVGGRLIPPSFEASSGASTVSEMSESGFENIPGLEPAASPEPPMTPGSKGKGPGRRKGRGRQSDTNEQRNSSSAAAQQSKIVPSNVNKSDLGPIPPKGSTLFKGKYFILNCGASKEIMKKKPRTRRMRSDTSSEGDGTESCEEMHFSITPFAKKYLKRQLEAGGGIVLDHYDEGKCRGETCFLISNRFNLTSDYILSLSSDIQTVGHDWVINCCIKDEPLPWMENLLPTGWSLEEERYVEWHERSSQAFKNVDIVLASDSGMKFLDFWRKVLITAGAHVRKISSKTMSSQEDISCARVVVTDHMCPAGILDRANETGVPLVSTVWVQQSLIHGNMRPFAGHPSYKYDYRHVDL